MTKKLFLLVALVLLIAIIFGTGFYHQLGPHHLKVLLLAMGGWGPVVFVLLFAIFEPMHVPGWFFVLAAVNTWSAPIGFLLSWIGAVAAAVVGFGFARYVGEDWVQAHLPSRLKQVEARLEEQAVLTVIVLRLIFLMSPGVHFLLGLSSVPFPQYLLGSIIGLAPVVAIFTIFGNRLAVWLAALSTQAWLVIGAAVLAALIIGAVHRAWRNTGAAPAE